jgi:urease accessory protein
MIGSEPANESTTFAANRARGRIAVSVGAEGGHTRRHDVFEEGSLRVRFPHVRSGECEAVMVNTAGGIAGGDRFDLAFAVKEGARLAVTGAAAEKIYRSTGVDSEISLALNIAPGGRLRWLPQETILFDRARLARRIDVDIAADASLILVESIVFGRPAMDEIVTQGAMVDRWRLRRDGRLVFAETLRLDGAIAAKLQRPAIGAGARAFATVLIAPGTEDIATVVRACTFVGEVGVSAWEGIALIRFCAADFAMLRQDLLAALAALDREPLPRLWLN